MSSETAFANKDLLYDYNSETCCASVTQIIRVRLFTQYPVYIYVCILCLFIYVLKCASALAVDLVQPPGRDAVLAKRHLGMRHYLPLGLLSLALGLRYVHYSWGTFLFCFGALLGRMYWLTP